jgi:hypothetical protein
MRIPGEVLLPYLSESDNKTLSEDKGAQPVDSSARLRATLSNSLSKQRPALEETIERLEQGQNGQGKPVRSGDQRGAQKAGSERRQEQRRKEQLPVLLDTRVSRSRRKSVRDSAIDCEI